MSYCYDKPSTYEMLHALEGSTTNWNRLNAALTENFLKVYAGAHDGAEPWPGDTTDVWPKARGVRALRTAAMEIAQATVLAASTRCSLQGPSPETLSWGGFLGGTSLVWSDHEDERAATAVIAEIIADNA